MDNQRNYQALTRDSSNSGSNDGGCSSNGGSTDGSNGGSSGGVVLEPFVGFILSPFDPALLLPHTSVKAFVVQQRQGPPHNTLVAYNIR